MPLTRLQAEAKLAVRRGRLLTVSSRSAAAVDPTATYGDALWVALRALGLPCADSAGPTDEELAAVPEGSTEALLDRAELRVLQTVVGNWDAFNEEEDDAKQDRGDLLKIVQDRLKSLETGATVAAAAAAGGRPVSGAMRDASDWRVPCPW